MRPYYEQDGITIFHADCRDVMDNRRERLNQALDMLAEQREAWKANADRLRKQFNELRAAMADANAAGMTLVRENERLRAVTPDSDFYVIVRSGDRIVMVPLETTERVELALQPEEWADIGAHFRRAWSRL